MQYFDFIIINMLTFTNIMENHRPPQYIYIEIDGCGTHLSTQNVHNDHPHLSYNIRRQNIFVYMR